MPKNLRTKIFLSLTILVILAIGGAALVTLFQGTSIALNEAEKSLESSQAAQPKRPARAPASTPRRCPE